MLDNRYTEFDGGKNKSVKGAFILSGLQKSPAGKENLLYWKNRIGGIVDNFLPAVLFLLGYV